MADVTERRRSCGRIERLWRTGRAKSPAMSVKPARSRARGPDIWTPKCKQVERRGQPPARARALSAQPRLRSFQSPTRTCLPTRLQAPQSLCFTPQRSRQLPLCDRQLSLPSLLPPTFSVARSAWTTIANWKRSEKVSCSFLLFPQLATRHLRFISREGTTRRARIGLLTYFAPL